MAATRIGSISIVQDGSNASSVSVTVPSGATLAVLFVTGYFTTSTETFSGGTASIGGAAMTVARAQDDSEGAVKGSAFYLINPTSGSQTFAWDWTGTANASIGWAMAIVYYSGTHATTPIGAVGGQQVGGQPATAGALTNTSADLVAAFAFASGQTAGVPANISYTGGLTEIQDDFQNPSAIHSWASYGEVAGSGSPITPGATWTAANDGGIIGLVIQGGVAADLAVALEEPSVSVTTF